MFIFGLVMTCFSVPFAISMFSTLEKVNNNPFAYRYANGFDESTVTILAWLSVIIAVIGICLMVFGWMNQKNKSLLSSIENATKQGYCMNCNSNVSTNNEKCPICGKNLKE